MLALVSALALVAAAPLRLAIDESGKFKLIDVVQRATAAGYVVEGVIAKRGMERRDIHGDVDVDLLNQDDKVIAALEAPRRTGRSLVASATGCNTPPAAPWARAT